MAERVSQKAVEAAFLRLIPTRHTRRNIFGHPVNCVDLTDIEAALPALREQLEAEVREGLEGLDRFGLRPDTDHPGFEEVGPRSDGAFIRRDQALATFGTTEEEQ